MKYIGPHVSAAGGVENAPLNAHKVGAKAFSLFTKNQRQWNATPLAEKSIELFKERCKELGYQPEYILPHASYLINLGNPDKQTLEKGREALIDEMNRCSQLGLTMLNFHPGSSLKKYSDDECLDIIAESINIALDKTRDVTAVIENTAGQGSNMGHLFEHLAYLIEKVEDKSRIGICLDTCHTFAAGYDISQANTFNEVMEHFDEIVGLKYLKGLHLNDSKKGLNSKIDRHEHLGQGELGIEVFKTIMNDKRFNDMPLILETPDETKWEEEVKLLYSFLEK